MGRLVDDDHLGMLLSLQAWGSVPSERRLAMRGGCVVEVVMSVARLGALVATACGA